MKRLALLPLLALAPLVAARAEDPATNAPIRTLEEAAKRFRDYKNRIMGEAFYPYTIKINDMTGERRAWIFTCESNREVEVPKQDAEADEEEPEWTQTVETVVLRVDSSGKVDELSREPAETRPFPPLWPPSALNYCRAAGIDPESISNLDADSETNMVFVVGTNASIRVSRAELARAEKECFFRAIAEADRIVVRDGGFDCCTPEEIIDRQKVFVVITNAAEIEGRRTDRPHGRATRSGAPLAHLLRRLPVHQRIVQDACPMAQRTRNLRRHGLTHPCPLRAGAAQPQPAAERPPSPNQPNNKPKP